MKQGFALLELEGSNINERVPCNSGGTPTLAVSSNVSACGFRLHRFGRHFDLLYMAPVTSKTQGAPGFEYLSADQNVFASLGFKPAAFTAIRKKSTGRRAPDVLDLQWVPPLGSICAEHVPNTPLPARSFLIRLKEKQQRHLAIDVLRTAARKIIAGAG